jgi:hypothetical protein
LTVKDAAEEISEGLPGMRGVSTLFAEGQKQDIFFNNAADFLRLDKSIYLPGATEYYDESGACVVEVVISEMTLLQ